MTKLAWRTLSVLAACLGATSAAASVVVLGSGPARGCYESARSQQSSPAALRGCNEALASVGLSFDNLVATHVNRGIVLLYGGRHQEAIADFDRAIALDPDQPESYLNKGSAYVRMGGPTGEAIALFNEALRRDTRRPELAYFGRAIAHEVAGDVRAAYQDYRRAQQAAPKWQEPREELTRFRVVRASGTL